MTPFITTPVTKSCSTAALYKQVSNTGEALLRRKIKFDFEMAVAVLKHRIKGHYYSSNM
jgi:hypothetical protein